MTFTVRNRHGSTSDSGLRAIQRVSMAAPKRFPAALSLVLEIAVI